MSHYTSPEATEAVKAQRQAIFDELDVPNVERAYELYSLFSPLWIAVGLGFVADSVKEQIIVTAQREIDVNEQVMNGYKGMSANWRECSRDIAKLKTIIAELG